MPKQPNEYADVPLPELEGLTLAKANEIREQFRAQLASLRALFRFPVTRYTIEERRQNAGISSFRQGELAAFHSILDAADLAPQFVAGLAEKDLGNDDDHFETDLLRARADISEMLREMSQELQSLSDELHDTSIEVGVLTKPIASHAYGILKSNAAIHDRLRSALAPAIDYYRSLVSRRRPEPSK